LSAVFSTAVFFAAGALCLTFADFGAGFLTALFVPGFFALLFELARFAGLRLAAGAPDFVRVGFLLAR
jgi:hypothetical protein